MKHIFFYFIFLFRISSRDKEIFVLISNTHELLCWFKAGFCLEILGNVPKLLLL